MTGGSASGANGTPIPSLSASENAVEAGAKAILFWRYDVSEEAWLMCDRESRKNSLKDAQFCLTAALTIERERWEAEAVARIEDKRAGDRWCLASYDYALDVAISALRMSDTREVSKDQCPDCEDGEVWEPATGYQEEYSGGKMIPCLSCNGTGKVLDPRKHPAHCEGGCLCPVEGEGERKKFCQQTPDGVRMVGTSGDDNLDGLQRCADCGNASDWLRNIGSGQSNKPGVTYRLLCQGCWGPTVTNGKKDNDA